MMVNGWSKVNIERDMCVCWKALTSKSTPVDPRKTRTEEKHISHITIQNISSCWWWTQLHEKRKRFTFEFRINIYLCKHHQDSTTYRFDSIIWNRVRIGPPAIATLNQLIIHNTGGDFNRDFFAQSRSLNLYVRWDMGSCDGITI